MTEAYETKKVLKLSATITLIFLAFVLMIIGWIGNVFAYGTQSGTLLDLRRGSRVTDFMFYQPFENKYTFYFGTQSVTGSGTTGYIVGSSTAFPKLEYNASTLKFNFAGAGLQNDGVDVTVATDLTGYIAVTGGTGTGNVLTNTTLAGAGTISANVTLSGNITANSLLITPAELGYLDSASSNIQSQITTATGSITNHEHSGADGTTQIAHNSVTGTGTNSHATLDTFVSSKAQASGLASLDGSSLVVQNPANSTATPTASKILIADGAGKINDGWLNSTVTLLGQSIELGTETTGNTDNITEGDTNLYYLDSRVNSAVGSLSVNALNDVNIVMNEGDMVKIIGGQLVAGSLTATVSWAGLTGDPLANGSISVSAGAGKIPVGSSSGKLDYSWINDVVRLVPTSDPAAGEYGQWYVGTTSSPFSEYQNDAYTKLLLHMNNPGTSTFIDSSPSNHTVTAFGDAIGTSTAKLGSGAGYFDGTGDYLRVADSVDWAFGTADFTIDLWIKYNSISGARAIMGQGEANNVNRWLFYHTATDLKFIAYTSSSLVIDVSNSWSPSIGTWYHIAIVRTNGDIKMLVNTSQIGTTQSGSGNIADYTGNLFVFANTGAGDLVNGYADEVRVSKGIARDPFNINSFTTYNTKYVVPNGDTMINVQSPGTATTEPSYIMLNGSGTIVGAGTTTGIAGTSTIYALWVDGATRATAFNVASSEKIKENIKSIKLKPGILEAEAEAKIVYLQSSKPDWVALHEIDYTYVGSDSATYIDTESMDADFATYVELAWATDLNQDAYIDNIQDQHEKAFWQMFSSIDSKSWTPKDKPGVRRSGFVVEEMPDVVKGDDGQSIDPMAILSYQSKATQALKNENVDAMKTQLSMLKALQELSATGTFTTQMFDRIPVLEKRIEILEGK